MARLSRAVVPGLAHHITQRGNHQENVFFDGEDRRVYLASLRANAAHYGVRLLGYCLMTNHVHIIAVPEREDSLSKAFGRTHADYARWQHVRRGQTGHLWQNRFFSCPLDSGHCWAALHYVESNPVRAGLVAVAWDWEWSSARAHVSESGASELVDLASWGACWSAEMWRRVLEKGVRDALFQQRIREATLTGRPLGDQGFAAALEELLARPLTAQRRGRKPALRADAASQ